MKIELKNAKRADVSHMERHYPLQYKQYGINDPDTTEHYKLLSYLASLFNNAIIFDVGTAKGMSALAMARSNNTIISYDIKNYVPEWASEYPNVIFKTRTNINDNHPDGNNYQYINSASFILLDIDPHLGKQEDKFLKIIKKIQYKGLILYDDIDLNDQMRKMWTTIMEPKYDITEFGHASGSGLVDYSEKHEIITYDDSMTRFLNPSDG